MEWIRAHPYASTLVAACLLVIAGTVFVIRGDATPAPSGISAWIGNPAALNAPTAPATGANNAQTTAIATATTDYDTGTLPYPSSTGAGSAAPTSTASSNTLEYDTLMAEIAASSHPSASKPAAIGSSGTASDDSSAWNFIPSGLIATSSPSSGRTPAQQALYAYGNEIGSYIEGYDAANSDQDQVLSDANNDRQNAAKAEAVEEIGTSLETVGQGIAETTGVPASAMADNTALANSYTTIGKALVTVGQSEALSDSTLVSAIEAYDTDVNAFNKDYIALATLFSVSGVTFAAGDPGSVFSFSSNSL